LRGWVGGRSKKRSKKVQKKVQKRSNKSSTKRFKWLYCGILHIGGSTKKVRKKVRKKSSKKCLKKCLKKSLLRKFENITNCRREGGEGREEGVGWGGWRIVIPMPEAINFVDGRRQKVI
jgi:hypothetical protein